jgi:hypothetical protein
VFDSSTTPGSRKTLIGACLSFLLVLLVVHNFANVFISIWTQRQKKTVEVMKVKTNPSLQIGTATAVSSSTAGLTVNGNLSLNILTTKVNGELTKTNS